MLNYSTGDPLRPWVKHIDDYFPYLKNKKEAKQIIKNESKALTNKASTLINNSIMNANPAACSCPPINKQSLIFGGIALYLLLRR